MIGVKSKPDYNGQDPEVETSLNEKLFVRLILAPEARS